MPMLTDTHGQMIKFGIPEQYKKIAINLSGGADSSILLYMIAKFLQDHNRTDTTVSVLSCANDLKHRWNPRKAADVINFVIDDLKFMQLDMHYSYYRDFQNEAYFHDVEKKLAQAGDVDLFVSGITANPYVGETATNARDEVIQLEDGMLDKRNARDNQIWYTGNKAHYWTPFINVDKRFVAAMYDQYGVRDNLFPITRSCEAIPDRDENNNPVYGKYDADFEKKPCGRCWWCLERKWAFGEF